MSESSRLLTDVLRADQFTRHHLDLLNNRADSFQKHQELAQAREDLQELYRPVGQLALFFWFNEQSSRTFGSFDSARALLGMEKLGQNDADRTSSTGKGESLKDTMMTADRNLRKFGGAIVVMRHKAVGSVHEAAKHLSMPIINAGDGQNEHPTQALLDMYTIKQKQGRLEDLHVVMGGDPRYSRTIHSLTHTLSLYPNNRLTFVGGKDLWLDEQAKANLESLGTPYQETTDMDVLGEADVVYWTRLQKERFSRPSLLLHPYKYAISTVRNRRAYQDYLRNYVLNEEILKIIPNHASIMHPLPRGPEMPDSIDNDPRAAYWDQVENAVPVRAALLEMILRHLHVAIRTNGEIHG